MPELTFATSEELQAELTRRFPAYVLVFRHYAEGGNGRQQERFTCGTQSQAMSEALGLLRWATLALEEQMKTNLRLTAGIQPLDPPR